jgi:hypothetical protein
VDNKVVPDSSLLIYDENYVIHVNLDNYKDIQEFAASKYALLVILFYGCKDIDGRMDLTFTNIEDCSYS